MLEFISSLLRNTVYIIIMKCTDQSSTKSWYLIYTKPRQEKLAQENLERQGYLTYLPLIQKNRKRITSVEAFFPRYLFISLNTTTDNWSPIRSTLGVANIVRFTQYPIVVSDSLISLLMSQEDPDTGLYNEDFVFKLGDIVRITDGALVGYEGIFKARSGDERVIVLLKVMGNQTAVKVDMDVLDLAT